MFVGFPLAAYRLSHWLPTIAQNVVPMIKDAASHMLAPMFSPTACLAAVGVMVAVT